MLTFLKLGGSLITDKSRAETPRLDVLERAASEISAALNARSDLLLLIGHGSGSFGHIVAERYGTHRGASTQDEWRGFAEVAAVAARLDELVLNTLRGAGLPIFRIQPSASARCVDGQLAEMSITPIKRAIQARLIPLVYGDVAIDDVRGATIISTETIFGFLARRLKPQRILLAGDYPGVLDSNGEIIPFLNRSSVEQLGATLAGSGYTDVTGGMASKVRSMLDLCAAVPGLSVRIFSADNPGALQSALIDDGFREGTRLSA